MAPHSVHLDREEPPCSGPETVPEEVVLGLLERVDTGEAPKAPPNRPTIAAEWSATRRPTSLRSKELGFHLMASKELKFWLHGIYGAALLGPPSPPHPMVSPLPPVVPCGVGSPLPLPTVVAVGCAPFHGYCSLGRLASPTPPLWFPVLCFHVLPLAPRWPRREA